MGRKGKRRRKGRPAGSTPREAMIPEVIAPEATSPAVAKAESPEATDKDRPDRETERRPRGLFGRGLAPESPYPPLGPSLARGIRPVGASVVIVVGAFLYLLAVWGFYVVTGAEPPAGLLAILTALPPAPSLFDALVLLQEAQGALVSLGLVTTVTVIRAIALTLLLPLAVQAVRGEPVRPREALRDAPRVFVSLLGILTAELGLSLLVFVLVQGFLGTQLAIFVVWLVGLQFLVMAPVVIVSERVAAAEALRRSVRAARLPGMRHFSLVISYFFLLQVITAIQAGVPFQATPSIFTWSYSLFVGVIHIGLLGTFAYRWLVVRDEVPTGPAKRVERQPR